MNMSMGSPPWGTIPLVHVRPPPVPVSVFDVDMIDVEEVVRIAHEVGYQEAAMAVLCQCEEMIASEGVMTLHELAALLGKRIVEVYIPLLS